MILGRLLEAAVLPGTFFLAWHAWGTLPPLVSATVEQCKLDCAAEYTTSEIMNSSSWSMWDTQRLVGPTKPSVELNATYPHAKAPFPLPFYSFCQLGCSYFFSASPQNTTCKGLCDDVYARNVSVGISDYAEKVELYTSKAFVTTLRLLQHSTWAGLATVLVLVELIQCCH